MAMLNDITNWLGAILRGVVVAGELAAWRWRTRGAIKSGPRDRSP